MRIALVFMMLTVATAASAQWDIQDSGTKASLRGIHSLGKGIAWASGTDGTVLRTEDGGYLWQHCVVPPGAEKLDFRGVQGFDANVAIVMSSGTGDLSRLYKTTDGCQTWKLLFTNPDKEGFWDALQVTGKTTAVVIGDPVKVHEDQSSLPIRVRIRPSFPIFSTEDAGLTWDRGDGWELESFMDKNGNPSESIFAASNSSLLSLHAGSEILFVTGGQESLLHGYRYFGKEPPTECLGLCSFQFKTSSTLASGESAGGFSVATDGIGVYPRLVLVGGDYKLPNESHGTSAYCVHIQKSISPGGPGFPPVDLGRYQCSAATTLPHGYRSAVAYDATTKTWITVGPNGTDISTDDGRNWRALTPGPNDAADADKNWNALSLPFVVGPHGRIGVLRPGAAKP
jgi:hypothetical protein